MAQYTLSRDIDMNGQSLTGQRWLEVLDMLLCPLDWSVSSVSSHMSRTLNKSGNQGELGIILA